MPDSPLALTLSLLVLSGCFLSLWKGSAAERLGGGVVLANLLCTVLVSAFLPADSRAVGELVVDGLTALGLLAIVLLYGSLWLGGVMLLYAVLFTLHAYYFVTERANDRLHAIVNNLDTIGVTLFLVTGTLVAWRRRTRAEAVA
jgi:hypothetical protein